MGKTIETNDGESISIQPFSLKYMRKLQKMNQFISPATRNNYRAPIPSPRPSIMHPGKLLYWGIIYTRLTLSSIDLFRKILAFIPRYAYIVYIAINSNDEIVGLKYFNIVGRYSDNRYIVEQGIVFRDDYQGKGIGQRFNKELWAIVENQVIITISQVYKWNERQVHVNNKSGFQKVGVYENEAGEASWLMARGRKATEILAQGDDA